MDVLESSNVNTLNFWLSCFVVEAHLKDGNPYPPTTINNILSGLNRYTKSAVPSGMIVPNFMNTNDPAFHDLRGAMEIRYQQLRAERVSAVVKPLKHQH